MSVIFLVADARDIVCIYIRIGVYILYLSCTAFFLKTDIDIFGNNRTFSESGVLMKIFFVAILFPDKFSIHTHSEIF